MPTQDNEDQHTSHSQSLDNSRARTKSLKSWSSRSRSRTRSRPQTPVAPQLNRIYSAGFHDDYGTYVNHPEDEPGAEAEALGPDVVPTDAQEDEDASPTNSHEKSDEKGRIVDEEEQEAHEDDHESDEEEFTRRQKGDRAAENGDLEKATSSSLKRQKTNQSSRSQRERDPNMVSWAGSDDPENPRNWSKWRKWIALIVVSSFTFISPVASSMVAPALPQMARDLGSTNTVLTQMMLSIFLLAYAFGPLFLGPLSEVYGRIPVLQLANLFFLIFNLACGFAQTTAQMLVFRFLSGLGGSAPSAIGGGIIADCFRPEERGKAIAVYSAAPLIGPAVGPIAGGFISENTTWRWVFWAVTIATAVVQAVGLIYLQETWAPKLLEQKTKKLRKETGNQDLYAEVSNTQSPVKKLETSLARPFRLMFTQPIIIALALYMAYLYGLVYLVISSFAALWTSGEYYNESVGIGGLHYIALGLGYGLGTQITAPLNDYLYKKMCARNGGVGRPEFRIPLMVFPAIFVPVGLFWYGWSAEARLFWIMPDIGAAILAAATITGFMSIQTYAIDTYTKFAASAIASIAFLRSLAAFGFPLFAPAMYNALGYGWGNSVLAFVAIAIGVPAPWLFWTYGEALRKRSKFAAGGSP